MRWLCILAVAGSLFVQQAQADDIKPEQLKKMYDESVVQLQSAQDRKNELAMENEKLTAKLAEMQKQLDDAHANEATFAEKTYQLRATQAAWEVFLRRYPVLLGQWRAFLADDVINPGTLPVWMDPNGGAASK